MTNALPAVDTKISPRGIQHCFEAACRNVVFCQAVATFFRVLLPTQQGTPKKTPNEFEASGLQDVFLDSDDTRQCYLQASLPFQAQASVSCLSLHTG